MLMDPKRADLPLRKHDAQAPQLSSLITQVPRRTSVPFVPKWFSAFCSCFRGSPLEPTCPTQTKPLLQPSLLPGKKTLVLDLDETLVHSSFMQEAQSKLELSLSIEGRTITIYVNIRPGVQEFLERTAKMYELVVFTASLAKYADPLLDQIDPRGLISARLFRESCIFSQGNYVKDLSMLGRDLQQVLIVDVIPIQNSPSSYSLHPNNAIPIATWFDDPEDRELLKMIPVLEQLATVEDVTASIEQTRKLMQAPLPPPIRPPEPFLDTPTSKDPLANRFYSGKRKYRRGSLGGIERGNYNSPVHAEKPTQFTFDLA